MKYYTYTLKMIPLNILCFILMVLCFLVTSIIYGPLEIKNVPLALVFGVMYLMLHEIIHYIGFIINKEVNKDNVVMGAELEKGVLYCMCKQKIHKKTILISIFAPLTIIGIITMIIGMIFKIDMLIFLSIINISGAIGDIVMGLFIISLPKDLIYLDLDDCTSFTLLCKEDISKKEFIGIKLVEDGIYNEKIKAHDMKKIKISKLSYFVLFIIIVLLIFMIL